MLTIEAFGGLRIRSKAGRPVVVPTRKAQALLVYLVLHAGEAQARGKLAALLWEDSNDAQARASLRQSLTTLRRALDLADDQLTASSEWIAWPGANAAVDVLAFERLLASGGHGDLEQAAALYTGDFLESFDAKSPAFQDWTLAERHRLRERALDAMSRLLAHYVAAKATDRGIALAVRLLALDPLQESVHRALMQLYVLQGREASALRQFRLCCEILARELRTSPEPATEELYRQIQRRRRSRPVAVASEPPHGETDDGPMPIEQATSSPTAADPATAGETMSEIRQVAVLVCQLAEPGRFDADFDPERWHFLAGRFHEVVKGVVASYGGTAERHLDDSALAFFGIPVAHGDDTERALRAALQLREVARFIDGEPGRSTAVQAGIADGRVLVALSPGQSSTPIWLGGGLANIAGRLASAAALDEVLLADSTFRQLSHRLVRAERRDLPGRTSEKSTTAWSLAEIADAPASRSPIVGRRSEIAQFAGALQACRESGHGQTFVLRGEAGIGKTRLVGEFSRLAREQGYACHAGLVLDFGVGRSEGAIPAIVRSVLEVEAGAESDRAAIEEAVAARLVPGEHRMYLYDLLQVGPPDGVRAIYAALDPQARERGTRETLAEVVRRAGQNRPRLFIIEDMHWASPTTLQLAAAISASVKDCPALLVLTTRSEGDPLTAARRALFGGMVTMDLGPLHFHEASQLAGGTTAAADAFTLRCIERAGGNPLFLEELLRGRGGAVDDLPGSIRSVVLARMDRLVPADRRALKAASVLGQRFSEATLGGLLGSGPYDCRGLVAEALLRPDGNDYLFSHALVQESAYASVPKSERRKLHLQAAELFSARDPLLRAEHLDRAEDPAAPRAYLEAAISQAAEYRYQRALELIGRGAGLAVDPADRFELVRRRADILHDCGAIAEAAAAYEEALTLAVDDGQRVRARLGRAAVRRLVDDLPGALADLEDVEDASERLDIADVAARAHLLHGNVLFPLGDVAGCLREHRRSLEFARVSQSADVEAAALGGIGDAEYMRGRMRTAHEHFRRCVDIARDRNLGRIAVANQPMVAITRMYCGDTRGALADALAAAEMAAKVGDRRAEAVSHHVAYLCHLALLQLDEAWREIEVAHTLAVQLKSPRFEAEALGFRAELHRLAGRRTDALADVHAALAIGRQAGFAYMGPTFLGTLALASDDSAVRAAALAEGDRHLATNLVGHNHFLFRRDAIEVCLEAADWDGALRHAAALENFTRPEQLPWTEMIITRGRLLAEIGKGERGPGTVAALTRLHEEAKATGYLSELPKIAAAIALLA